jgi:hypothetical protein
MNTLQFLKSIKLNLNVIIKDFGILIIKMWYLCYEFNLILAPLMGWTIGVLGFDFRRGMRISLLTTVSRTALGSTQPPIQ